VDYDKYVRQTEGPVELVLLSDGKQQRVEAKVNRRAQTKTRAARIMGGTKLRDWFLNHFDVGASLDVDLRASEMRIQKAADR
jgi:hypothetical protein